MFSVYSPFLFPLVDEWSLATDSNAKPNVHQPPEVSVTRAVDPRSHRSLFSFCTSPR